MTTAIVLAGGLGTRLRSDVADLPKPMAPVCGRPFLSYLLDYWNGQGIDRFIMSVGSRHENISNYFKNRYGSASLEYVVEEDLLDTGGALLLASDCLNDEESFLLLNGDTYFAVDLAVLRQFAERIDSDFCLSLFRTAERTRYMGVELDEEGRITSLRASSKTGILLGNGGVYWIRRPALNSCGFVRGQKASLEKDILPAALQLGLRLSGVEVTATFLDIGVPGDYRSAASVLNAEAR